MSSKLPSVTSPPWDMGTKRVVSLVIVLVSILVASRVGSSAWTTLLVTLVLAYLMSPLVTFFERRVFRFGYYDLRRTVSVLLAWVIVLAALGLFVGLVVPAMVAQFRQFADDLPDLIEGTEEDLKNSLDRPITIGDFEFVPWDELQKLFKTEDGDTSGDVISDRLKDAATTLVEPLLGILGSAVSFFFNALVMLMMLFYLMRDGPKFVEHLVGSIP
jgi:predicted PurR-regulated permease PerM